MSADGRPTGRIAGALRGLGRGLSRRLAPVAEPSTPALLRIAVGGYHLWHVGRKRKLYYGVHRTDTANFDPVGPAKVLRKPLPPVVADRLVDA